MIEISSDSDDDVRIPAERARSRVGGGRPAHSGVQSIPPPVPFRRVKREVEDNVDIRELAGMRDTGSAGKKRKAKGEYL